MYIPRHFNGGSQDDAYAFMEENSFAQLTSVVDGELVCSHLPLLLDRQHNCLLGHLARANPQAKALAGQRVQCTFAGPHGYVSPSWYKAAGVPTWNYQAAHVYGAVEIIDDEAQVHALVRALTGVYEQAEAKPWVPEYNPRMVQAIVGFSIAIERVDLKYKLSQNRSVEDCLGVIEALRARGNDALASAMAGVLNSKKEGVNED